MERPILITGGSGGIGFRIALEVLKEGNQVIITSRNVEQVKMQLIEKCIEVGVDQSGLEEKIQCLSWNLSQIETLEEYVSEINARWGALGGFVHCAGHDKVMPLYRNKPQDIEELFRIHVYAPMQLISLFMKKKRMEEGSGIVLISSLAAHEGAAGHTAYAAAKGALEGFLPSAACELAAKKLRLNLVVPGAVLTQMSEGYISKMTPERREEFEAEYPLGLGRPEDVAYMATYLLSERAKWLTGQKYVLDGGHLIRG